MLFRSFYQGGEIKGSGDKWSFLGSDGRRHDISTSPVRDIYFFHEVSASSDFFRYAGGKNTRLHFLKYGFYQTTFIPALSKPDSGVILKQYKAWKDPVIRLTIAKRIVEGEISAAHRVWKDTYESADLLRRLESVSSVEEVRAVEAEGMKRFWSLYRTEFPDFVGRIYNPPPDIYNAAVSMAYAHLYGAAFTALKLAGLDPRIGYLHENRFRTYVLHLDMADIYKPLVASFAIDLIKKGVLHKRHFHKMGIGVFLSDRGRKRFLNYWDDFLRNRTGWCGKYSFLVMMVRDARDLRGFLVSGKKPWTPCVIGGGDIPCLSYLPTMSTRKG